MVIQSVAEGSIGERCGICTGDILLRINDREIRDVIDYAERTAEEKITLSVQMRGGIRKEIVIEKDPFEDLGIVFETDGFGGKRVCRNKCIFCFVDQLPKGMRKSLYLKDDDWRMSFLMGSYITLTNLSEEDISRIIEQKLSPLYVSIHAADPKLRAFVLGNSNEDQVFASILNRLVQGGIRLHTQIVLCEGINDKDALDDTIRALRGLWSGVQSVAVVPVGLTEHRNGCYPLSPISKESARDAIRRIEAKQSDCLKRMGTRFVFASDELYIKAGLPLPEYDAYEDFPQIENGVGMVRAFFEELNDGIDDFADASAKYKKAGLVTGEDFYPYLKEAADRLNAVCGMRLTVYKVKNRFFGESVSVTGLLTGKDIIEQVKEAAKDEEVLLLSRCCFNEADQITLDDMRPAQLEEQIGIPIRIVENDGYELVQALTEQRIEE